MLNCALGELPLKYLGIPISDNHLNMGAFLPVTQNVVKRLNLGKEHTLHLGGDKFLLINV